jgi:hypothetical protein
MLSLNFIETLKPMYPPCTKGQIKAIASGKVIGMQCTTFTDASGVLVVSQWDGSDYAGNASNQVTTREAVDLIKKRIGKKYARVVK